MTSIKELLRRYTYELILAAFILFRLYVMSHVELIDDEAYHWTWAKNAAASYYDHPGMVAWIIWPFIQLLGDHAFVIRLPGLLTMLGVMWFVYQSGKEIFDVRVGKLASLLIFVIPLWGFAGLGTLPDVPLALFWMMIFYFFWQSVRPDEKQWPLKKSWLLIGVSMGLGMNSKLACCLIGLGMGLYLILTPRVRRHLLSPWPYVAVVICFLLMAPIFWWQMNHDWATFDYQFHRRHQEAAGVDWNRWLQFWAYQWIFMSPGIYWAMLLGFFAGFAKWKNENWRFITLLSLPTLAIFYYQPLMAAFKPHWSGPAYLILLLAACKIYLDGFQINTVTLVKPRSLALTGVALAFLIPLNLLYVPLLTPIIPKIYALSQDPQTWEPKWDFSNEFYGWKEVGQKVKDMQLQIKKQDGYFPLLGAQRYELISQLTYGSGQKVWQLTFEKDQFQFDQPADEKKQLLGANFLVVNNDKYPRDPREVARFDSCEKTDFPVERDGIRARTFFIYYCKNYQGLL